MNDNYKIATSVGKYFKNHPTMTVEGWNNTKEYATIAEKAMIFSQRSGKPLEETITTKWKELKEGLILAKNHEVDDFTRGFSAGWFFGSDTTDAGTTALLEEVEKIWDTKWFDTDDANQKTDDYVNIIIAMKKKKTYRDMGLITVQDLTRICLKAMENGIGDKFILRVNSNVNSILFGNIMTEKEQLEEVNVVPTGVDINDVVAII